MQFWKNHEKQFLHKEDGKKPLDQILHKLFDGDNYNVT